MSSPPSSDALPWTIGRHPLGKNDRPWVRTHPGFFVGGGSAYLAAATPRLLPPFFCQGSPVARGAATAPNQGTSNHPRRSPTPSNPHPRRHASRWNPNMRGAAMPEGGGRSPWRAASTPPLALENSSGTLGKIETFCGSTRTPASRWVWGGAPCSSAPPPALCRPSAEGRRTPVARFPARVPPDSPRRSRTPSTAPIPAAGSPRRGAARPRQEHTTRTRTHRVSSSSAAPTSYATRRAPSFRLADPGHRRERQARQTERRMEGRESCPMRRFGLGVGENPLPHDRPTICPPPSSAQTTTHGLVPRALLRPAAPIECGH